MALIINGNNGNGMAAVIWRKQRNGNNGENGVSKQWHSWRIMASSVVSEMVSIMKNIGNNEI
jgi:hypothetical protein